MASITRFWRRAGLILVLVGVALIMLAGCGSGDDSPPPPTLASMDEFATQDALKTASAALPPTQTPASAAIADAPTETATILATILPSVSATPSPTPSATPSATPSPTLSSTPTSTVTLDPADQTATANVQIAPVTLTAQARQDATATAIAATPPTSTPVPQPDKPYQIVYYSNRNGSDDLFLMTRDGAERALITTLANERDPSCAPDGSAVVYTSDETGDFQLFLLPLNQPTPIQLTDSEGMNFAPVFSPDGRQIAFVSTRSNGIPTIWIMNADGTNPYQVTTELGRDTSPAWGPDGKQLLFSHEQTGPWDLFLTILDEGVEGEFPVMPPDFSQGNQLWPAFDGLGERIIYTQWDNLEDAQTSNIYLLDFELSAPRAVRAAAGADIAWSWFDSDHLLASVGGPDDVQIALVNVETGEVERLSHTGTFNGGARLCTVRPDVLPPEPTPMPSPTPSPPPTHTPTPGPTPVVLSPKLQAAQGHGHIVQPGDTLMNIGYKYGVNWAELAMINTLPNPDRLSIGQRLIIPITHTGHRISGYLPAELDVELYPFVRKEIVVQLEKQIATAYENGRVIKSVTVSTGLPGTPTVSGEFSIYVKRPSQTMSGPGYYLPDVPYVMYFYQSYGLHGTYWHDNFGEPMSHGCVNLRTPDAEWFYNWAEIGTPVLVKP